MDKYIQKILDSDASPAKKALVLTLVLLGAIMITLLFIFACMLPALLLGLWGMPISIAIMLFGTIYLAISMEPWL